MTLPNLMAPEVHADPYSLYAELRRSPPAQIDPFGMWAVSRYDDLLAVMKDHEHFSSTSKGFVPDWLDNNILQGAIGLVDPPYHTYLRGLVSHAFGPSAMARLEPRIRALAEDLAERAVRRGDIDFVADFTLPLPGGVIAAMLGLDTSMFSKFKEWADLIFRIPVAQTPEERNDIRACFTELERYFSDVIDERRRHPSDDLLTEMIQAKVDGKSLSQGELVTFLYTLLMAGLDTTSLLLANTMLVFSDHPELFSHVRADMGLIPQLVEEVLRYEPPVQVLFRTVLAPVEVGGVSIPEGAIIALMIAAAGRDERQFPEPDQFRLDRMKPTNHVFGHGIHFCLGAALSRIEARLGLSALLPRIRGFTIQREDIRWVPGFVSRGPLGLPMRLLADAR